MSDDDTLISILRHASSGVIVDASHLHEEAMLAVDAGYLAHVNPAGGDADFCRFTLTDMGRELLATEEN